ncbi:hypothetical protein HBB16_14475 [Pseudonocardia sp. MCCB 268]|nr:hypothetical protein [Pseudonocardia cytotoxica]
MTCPAGVGGGYYGPRNRHDEVSGPAMWALFSSPAVAAAGGGCAAGRLVARQARRGDR